MMMTPTEPTKPTAWLRQLDLRSGMEERISKEERGIEEYLASQPRGATHATRHLTANKSAKRQVKEWLKPLTDNHIQLLDIIPIGGICLCHHNAKEAVVMMNKYTWMSGMSFREARGYNVMTCRCGYSAYGEIHSVIYCNEKSSYYDLTEDMFGEEKKWFIEVPELTKNYKTGVNGRQTRKYDFILNNNGCRKCNVGNEHNHYNGDLEVIKHHFG